MIYLKIGILGTGVYGIALAEIMKENNNEIVLWTKFEDEKNNLENDKKIKTLNNYEFNKSLKFTTNIEEAMNNQLIFIAVPAEFLEDTCKIMKPYIDNQHICIATKGIGDKETIIDIVKNNLTTNNIGIISGPTFAVDIVNKVPIGFTIASENSVTRTKINDALKNHKVCTELSEDIYGVSICGSIKNILAIGSGIINGMDLPISTQSLFITKAIKEIQSIIKFYGGDERTILTLAGIGDLILTCTSEKSRNFTLGKMIGKKMEAFEINDYIKNTTIEGITTIKAIHYLIYNNFLDLPIINCIYNIIFNKTDANSLLLFITK